MDIVKYCYPKLENFVLICTQALLYNGKNTKLEVKQMWFEWAKSSPLPSL